MANATITFRTDSELKKEAQKVFESIGMNLSVALNLFMKQAVLKGQFPCSLEAEMIDANAVATYPEGFFDLFGSMKELDFIEPDELDFGEDSEREGL